ncbi:MAG: 50S ribosomal protein L13 [Patescibacteria group bacterium]|nr:50S ribosomal protein L13 [Patescibacteria group bacterium]
MIKDNKTPMQRKEDIKREWHLVDVEGKILGHVATEIAELLIGKHKTTYTPHVDGGDFVVVVNAAKVTLSRNKEQKKVYRWHTGYPGGLKEKSFKNMINDKPDYVIHHAVKNMLPKNKMRKRRLIRLKIYAGEEHSHQSQLEHK